MGPARIMLAGWLLCWSARWWLSPAKHRRLVALVLKRLNTAHRFLRVGHRWWMRLHLRTFKATLRNSTFVR